MLGVSALVLLVEVVVLIVSLSSMFFMLPFENISVTSFSPDDRKWEFWEMAEAKGAAAAAVAAGSMVAKTVASGVASLSRVTVQLVASFAMSSFISLIL